MHARCCDSRRSAAGSDEPRPGSTPAGMLSQLWRSSINHESRAHGRTINFVKPSISHSVLCAESISRAKREHCFFTEGFAVSVQTIMLSRYPLRLNEWMDGWLLKGFVSDSDTPAGSILITACNRSIFREWFLVSRLQEKWGLDPDWSWRAWLVSNE